MISTSTLIAFTLLNVSFALIPGPDVICILSNSLTRGWRAGALVCAGIACAAVFHVAAASLGLSAVLAAVPSAFMVIKTAGAAYLVYIGWKMIRSPISELADPDTRLLSSPFAQGAVSNLFNPKVALFFLAIVPQFVDPSRGHAGLQTFFLGLVSIASGTAINLSTATLGSHARSWIASRPGVFRRIQQAAGAALIGLGFKVALERAR